ncbi:MAG: hypothetical protein EOP85_22600, partial [Verrucomicrobiaceae bacterium]
MNKYPISRLPDPLRLSLVFASMAATASAAVPLIGNLTVIQNDTGNNATSVSATISQGNGPTYHAGSRGDFGLRFDGATPAEDVANGILIATISENGRS